MQESKRTISSSDDEPIISKRKVAKKRKKFRKIKSQYSDSDDCPVIKDSESDNDCSTAVRPIIQSESESEDKASNSDSASSSSSSSNRLQSASHTLKSNKSNSTESEDENHGSQLVGEKISKVQSELRRKTYFESDDTDSLTEGAVRSDVIC